MNAHLRDRILRKLDALPEDRGYQVLDYIEFLESKYAERQNPANAFTRFTEAVEDRLRAGKVSASAIAETMGLLNRAGNVLSGAMAAGRSVANDIVTAAQGVTTTRGASTPSGSASTAGTGGGPSGTTAAPGTAGPAASNAAGPTNSGTPSEASS